MKKLQLILGIIGLFIIMNSCSNDDNNLQNQMKVFAKGTYTTESNKTGFPSNIIVLTSFKINVDQLTLKYYTENDDDNGETGRNDGGHDYKKVTVTGPWELDLLNQTTVITTVSVPNGTYKEAELELSKSLAENSLIFNKTVEIAGTINGMPFIFWHDFEQKLKLKYSHGNESVIINNNSFDLVFNFDLNQLMDMIDLSAAVDGDGDGIIEIGPDDTDGNNELATLINQHFGHCGGIEHNNHH